MERVDCVIIGAGVIGLACARALALAGREVIILERAMDIGTETSARNSEVIHAGIYYATDSLKAKLCVQGRQMLYHYCEERDVNYQRCGKLIVATRESQLDALESLRQKAHQNGVPEVEMISAETAWSMEAGLHCLAALWSPVTGIVDSHGFMLGLLGDAENHGAVLVLNSPVEGGQFINDGIELKIGGSSPMSLAANTVINAAGLWAQPVAQTLSGLPESVIPERHLARGIYFSYHGSAPFSHLVYPMPESGGLGCHYTLDLNGKGRFGPDVEWVDDIDYLVNPQRVDSFYQSIRDYWPDIPDGSLQPDYAGVRPKVAAAGQVGDFIIQGPEITDLPGLVNLYGIESPGLTASLAIAEVVKSTACP